MFDEPRRHPRFLILLGLVALATVPTPFIGGELRLVWGLPLWLWWSLGFTTAMAALTSWALMRFWSDDDAPTDAAADSAADTVADTDPRAAKDSSP